MALDGVLNFVTVSPEHLHVFLGLWEDLVFKGTHVAQGWPRIFCVTENDCELPMLLLSPRVLACNQAPSCLVCVVLEIEPRASCVLGQALYEP